MLCDIEVQDTPTVVTDDEKAIERGEGDRRNREEVHRGNRFTVITEKGKPAPGWLRISRRPFQISQSIRQAHGSCSSCEKHFRLDPLRGSSSLIVMPSMDWRSPQRFDP